MSTKKKQNNWLRSELPRWEADGLVTNEQRQKLELRYPEYVAKPLAPFILLILGVFAIVIGVIVLFSHNWENLGRPARTVIVFAYQAVGVCFAGFVLWKEKGKIWREVSAVVLNLSLLGSLAIIGQTYQMGGNLTSLLFAWLLLSIPTCYIMRSNLCTMIYLLGIYAWISGYSENNEGMGTGQLFLMVLAVKVPVLWLEVKAWHNYLNVGKSKGLVLLSALNFLAVCMVLINHSGNTSLVSSLLFFTITLLTIIASKVHEKFDLRLITNPLEYLSGFILFISMLTFSHITRGYSSAFYYVLNDKLIIYKWLILFVLPLILFTVLVIRKSSFFHLLLSLYPLFILVGVYFSGSIVYLLTLNLYILVLCVLLITNGEAQNSIYQVMAGSVGIAAILIERLISSEAPLIVKGSAFIAIGVAFVMVNLLMVKRISSNKGVKDEA